jgi:hypothetical protein
MRVRGTIARHSTFLQTPHMHDLLGYGLGMEMLALGEKPEGPAE